MTTPIWKQREVQLREKNLLKIAKSIISKQGFPALTMERIAAASEYSKGTVYQHFSSKEDIMTALLIEAEQARHVLLQKAFDFQGLSRERMLAMGIMLYASYKLYPESWDIEQMVSPASLKQVLKPERWAEYDKTCNHTASFALRLIDEAIQCGDLRPPFGLTQEQVFIGLMSAVRGLYESWAHQWWDSSWVGDRTTVQRKLINACCDGFQWHPLASNHDYDATVLRIGRDLLTGELSGLG